MRVIRKRFNVDLATKTMGLAHLTGEQRRDLAASSRGH
jgi:hypothetical protein